jgi:hypothetical protein
MKNFYRLLILLTLLVVCACESKIDFKLTKESQGITTLSSIELVDSYNLRFNPKANGAIIITLASGAEYKAEGLNASQLSSLVMLLKSKEVQFDTKNKEFLLKENTNE